MILGFSIRQCAEAVNYYLRCNKIIYKFDFWYYNYILDGFNCQCIAKNEWYNPPLER